MNHDANLELLVVDDEDEVRTLLSEYFALHGLQVRVAADPAQARQVVATMDAAPAVAVLDINMPGEDGLSLARWLRDQYPAIGIVFLTALGDLVDRVVGLEVGGDDYIAKPFEPRELLARVRSLLRRLSTEASAPPAGAVHDEAPPTRRVEFGRCQLDLDERRLIGADGVDIAITSAEFDLLSLFARAPNRPLSRDQIMEGAHNRDWNVYDRSIDLRIMRLRRKIEQNPDEPEVLKTVRNVGYVFVHRPHKPG